jgi:hypothetical protein
VTEQTVDHSERIVCAILAAQVAVLRDHIDTGVTAELLWQTTDALSRLSKLVLELTKGDAPVDTDLNGECAAALVNGAEINRSLDGLAFLQAQRQDFARQMADCVVAALERLAGPDAPIGARLTPEELAAMYVSEEQRKVHTAVVGELDGRSSSDPLQPADEDRMQMRSSE